MTQIVTVADIYPVLPELELDTDMLIGKMNVLILLSETSLSNLEAGPFLEPMKNLT